jgi:hypothetical protein
MKDNPKEDNKKANCITGVGLFDAAGNLKAVLQSHKKTDEKFLQGLIDYDLSKIVCCCKGSYSFNMEETELSFFHLLGRYDTGVSPASKFGNPNDDADKFVNKLHAIMSKIKDLEKQVDLKPEEKKLLELYNSLKENSLINKINTTKLEHQFLGQTTENLLTFKVNGKNPIDFTRNSLKEAEESNIEAEKNCIPRFKKLIEFLEQFETKPRSDSTASTASTASMKTVSSTESQQVDEELVKLRKEYEDAEKELKTAINAGDCRKLKNYIDTINNDIDEYKKRCNKNKNNWYWNSNSSNSSNSCETEDKLINTLTPILEKRTSEYNKLDCQSKGGKRKTAKKQHKTRKSKKSKRATKKH